MKNMNHSTMRRLLRLVMVAAVAAMASCSSDELEQKEAPQPATTVELMPCFPAYGEEWPATSAARTRANDPVEWVPGTTPSGYYSYSALNGLFEKQIDLTNHSIGIFFTQDDDGSGNPKVMQGYFFCQNPLGTTVAEQSWRSTIEIKTDGITPYQLYGFIPYEEATGSVAPNPTYADGAVLTLTGLQAVTTSDVCVVVGAKEGTDAGHVAYPGIKTGQFDFMAHGGVDAHNFVYLLFDHIYSAMRFCFTVGKSYDEVRTIKLREVLIKATGEGLKSNYNAVITLKKNTLGNSPIPSDGITFNSNGYTAAADWVELYKWNEIPTPEDPEEDNGSNEVILKNGKVTHLVGRFMPGWSSNYTSNFTLRSTYDVYDKQGNLVRKDCVADNNIDLKSLFKTSVIERGRMYSLNLQVEPTYLYMLSEPDLDNPTVKLKKE